MQLQWCYWNNYSLTLVLPTLFSSKSGAPWWHIYIYISDSTLQNSSWDQLVTVLLYGSEKFAFNVSNYLKALFCSTPFLTNNICVHVFVVFFTFLMSDCTGLTVINYILLELCLVLTTVLGIIFHICGFIVNFIVSDFKDPWYIRKDVIRTPLSTGFFLGHLDSSIF